MNRLRLPLFFTVAVLSAALALGGLAHKGSAAESLWQTDFKAAQAKAKQEKKYMLVDFTGSDWCIWCVRLHNEVFDKEEFKSGAPKQYVLVELDFPNEKEQSDELKKQNKELAKQYEVKGFPTVLVMDADGQVVARTGYRPGGPEKYLDKLAEFSKLYENVLALKAKLDKSQGMDRAKLLDEIVQDYQKLGSEEKKIMAWSKEIIALDPDNKAGLKVKYEFPVAFTEASDLMKAGKITEAKSEIDKALELKGVAEEKRQEAYMLKFQICFMQKKFAELVAALKGAKEAAPDSRMAPQIDALILQFAKVAEAQEAAEKLEADLAKSAGLDRAKLLDKLVDIKRKLVRFDPAARKSIKKWTQEIIALDADNKAGLKKKHELKLTLDDVEQLIEQRKTNEAGMALDRVLESEGISGDERQQAEYLKAHLAYMRGNQDEAATHLKKALEAAPKGELAPMVEKMLRQYERTKKPAKKAEDE